MTTLTSISVPVPLGASSIVMTPSSAGPSRLSSFVKPPPPLTEHDRGISEEARAYLSPKRRFLHLLPSWDRSKRGQRKGVEFEEGEVHDDTPEGETPYPTLRGSVLEGGLVELHDELLHEACEEGETDKPVYRWAVLYENQRGCVLGAFSLDLPTLCYITSAG